MVAVGRTPFVPISPSETKLQKIKCILPNWKYFDSTLSTLCAVESPLVWFTNYGLCVHLPLQRKPGREADVNSQRKWKTNDNWFVIQQKYLFHKFFSLLESHSPWVWKEEELRKKGRFAEEKTKWSLWRGRANRITLQPAEEAQIAQPSAESGSSHTARIALRMLPFPDILCLLWRQPTELTPAYFSGSFPPGVTFLFPPQLCTKASATLWLAMLFLPPQSQVWQSQPSPIWDCFFILKKRWGMYVERKACPLLE